MNFDNLHQILRSLYEQMNRAARIYKNNDLLARQIRRQLAEYLPVISGARMMKDYLHLIFGK